MQIQLPQYLKTHANAIGIACVAFFAYAAFPFAAPPLYNSPDDHANAFFIQRFVDTGTLWYTEPLNALVHERIVTRSMRAIGDRVVPIGFPGLAWLYGMIAWIAGWVRIPVSVIANFTTPFLVAVSVAVLIMRLKQEWKESDAVIAGVLYAANPALWYYASRGLYPNAAVMALVVIAISMPSRAVRIGGLTAALIIRPLEALWIFPLYGLAAYWEWKVERVRIQQYVTDGALALVLAASACLALNVWIYGDVLTTGYSAALRAPNALATLAPTLRATLGRVIRFGFFAFPIHGLLALTSAMWLWNSKEGKRILPLAVFALTVFAGIFANFGARDLIDESTPSIGISFIRYWLPVFVAGSALIALAVRTIQQQGMKVAVVAVYGLCSAYSVWLASPDSLWPVRQSLLRYEAIQPQIVQATPQNAIVIVEQADKILFPERRVIAWLRNPGAIQDIPILLAEVPVYYFGITISQTELDVLRAQQFPKGLVMTPVQRFEYETLYEFSMTRKK